MNYVELFGTLASVVTAISLTMKNIKRLRIINGIGSVAFAVYALFIHSWPTFGLNVFIAVIDGYYLLRMRDAGSVFEVVKIDPEDSSYLERFLRFYRVDIEKFFPGFDPAAIAACESYFILRDLLPVSLVAFRRRSGSEVEIAIDYAIPNYRDFRNARYFFEHAAALITGEGFDFVEYAAIPRHARYLEKLGFVSDGAEGNMVRYRRTVGNR